MRTEEQGCFFCLLMLGIFTVAARSGSTVPSVEHMFQMSLACCGTKHEGALNDAQE